MAEFSNKHRGHAIKGSAPFLLDGSERRFRIEACARVDDRRATSETSQVAQHQTKAMVERHRHADSVTWLQLLGKADKPSVVQNIPV